MAKAEVELGDAGSGTTVEDVKLHIAALEGNCRVLSNFIGNNINRAITDKQETSLHIATLARQDKFVEKLVSRLKKEDLEIVNIMGSNPLCYAAISGSVKIAKHMVQAGSHRLVNPESGVKPLLVAASVEHGEMVRYLFDKTDLQEWNKVEQAELFTACISMGLYDIALTMLDYNEKLATEQNKYGETALLVFARMPSIFKGECQPWLVKRRVHNSGKCFQVPCKRTSNQSQALELLGKLFSCALSSDEENPLIRTEEVENLLYEAAEVGNVDFLIKLIQYNPQLVWAKDEMTGTIFHIAVKNRHENIFSLLFQLGAIKDIIAKIVTSGENNLLHIAAKLAPQDKLNTVRPAALKIQRELLWFKEVEKIVPNSYREMKNSDGFTPRALFLDSHKCLREEGERWMKETARASMFVTAIVAIILFIGSFSVPLGFDNSSGKPVLLKQNLFTVFSISDAVGLVSSSVSMLMFLSILTSPYVEEDFLVSLPSKLMIGLTSLFISITTVMVAFSATLNLYHHGIAFVSVILVFVPMLYFSLIYSLLVELFRSLCGSRFLFKPRNRLFN